MDNELLKNLNSEQLDAVKHTSGPLLIVAGAGTGKTTVITRRIAYLVEQNSAKPDEILALTFTEKAATEMEERVDLLMPLGYYDKWISTFHSFCERILKNHALDIGLPNDFELLDGVRQWIFIYKNFEKFDLDYYKPLGSPNRFIDALLTHFSRCKDELITPGDYLNYAEGLRLNSDQSKMTRTHTTPTVSSRVHPKRSNSKEKIASSSSLASLGTGLAMTEPIESSEIARLEEVANAYHTYQKLMVDNNYLDFGDLINYALELFKKRPNILKYYRQKFKYIMVDEFQDTNFAQFQLVKLLAGDDERSSDTNPSTRFARSGHNLTVVGDDDQSIYKFRGASVSNILKFKQEYPDSKQITLTDNYRSKQNILDLAYKFIQANNPDRLEVKLKISKKLISSTGSEGIIQVLENQDLSGEMDSISKKINEIKKAEPEATYNDFAVLIRANSAADELLPILANNNIPYTFVANKGLYKKPIIVDLLAFIRLLDNSHDSISLYRVFSLPKFHLTHQELSSLLEHSHKKTLSLFESLTPALTLADISADGKNKIRELQSLLQKHSVLAKTHTAAEMLVMIIKDLELEQKLKDDTLETSQNRELVDQFYKKIENFEKQNAHKDLHSFLLSLDLEIQAGSEGEIRFDPNSGPESVKVLTVHSAKGLEFKYVFIINLVEQRFPTRARGETIEIPGALVKDILPEGDFHLQEERRLFYVAITRAKLGLYLTWAKDYGGKALKKPSQFLAETGLVPSDKISKATGKVVFTKTNSDPLANLGPSGKNNIVYKKLPTRFSYSALNDFKSCPLLYKYKHYLKLPTTGSQHQSFGITIHKVFEEFLKLYKNNLAMSQTDLFGKKASDSPLPEKKFLNSLYEKNWVDDWYENKEQKENYRKEGRKMLDAFYKHLETTIPKPKFIEQFFNLKLGSYAFVGKIDRADESDLGLVVIDYKTGKTPKILPRTQRGTGAKTDLDQLFVYQWAAEELLKQKVAALKYWYLKDDQFKEEELADEKQIAELKSGLLETIEEIIEAVKYDKFKELDARTKGHKCEFGHLE